MAVPCELCGDTGFEIVTRDGKEFAQACSCRRVAGAAGDAMLAACRIPARYEHCTFGNFEPYPASRASALEKCMRYAAGYPYVGATDEGLGLLLTGTSGGGKTHLAVSVLRDLVAEKGARGQFWDFHSLIREIRNSYNDQTRTTELDVLAPVVEADVLLLDDLGAWKMTDWMVDTLFYILNGRYMAKRATIITTNFQDKPASAARGDDSFRRTEYLVDRIGVPLRSRLLEMCLVIEIAADDYRQVRQDGNREAILGAPKGVRPRPE
jgi:DNA replication protein DnaC